jgi:hypothetical protein
MWYSKVQSTVETSTFGSEFVGMRIMVEMLEALRYKLRMLGVLIDGPSNVFCDNKLVVTNSRVPTSTLKKKHNSIAYHRVRKGAYVRESRRLINEKLIWCCIKVYNPEDSMVAHI